MDARQLVESLLEADEVDPKAIALRTEEPYYAAARWALRQWLSHMENATNDTLADYIRNITHDATSRFTLDEDDQYDISRMLMAAWQYERLGMKSSEIAELKRQITDT